MIDVDQHLSVLGKVLKEQREFLNLRQSDLADLAGASPNTIGHAEQGRTSIKTLIRLADALGLHTSEIFEMVERRLGEPAEDRRQDLVDQITDLVADLARL